LFCAAVLGGLITAWRSDDMATKKILVPYNFTNYDQKALDFVAGTFRDAKDIQITLFHAYTPLPEIETDSNAVLGRLKDTMKSLRQKLRDQESLLKEVIQTLLLKGIADNQLDYIFEPKHKDVSEEIAETATGGNYEIIVLSRKAGKMTRLFSRSVSGKLLSSTKGMTVCVVS
jgi:hypothetical protein